MDIAVQSLSLLLMSSAHYNEKNFSVAHYYARAYLSWKILRQILTTQFCNISAKIENLSLKGGTQGHFSDILFTHRSNFVQTNQNPHFLQTLLQILRK